MSKTQWKDAIRNIKKKKVSWFSIIIVVMLTVAVFLGCRFYNDSVAEEGENYFKIYKFKDLDVISSTGLLESEIEKIKDVEGVKDVEGYNQIDATVTLNGDNKNITLICKTDRISIPELVSGELPAKRGEVAVGRILADKEGIKLGDSLHITAAGNQGKLLGCNDFKVTAIVNHTEFYLTRSNDFMMISDESFDTDILNGGYLRAIVLCDLPDDTDIYSDKYFDTIADVEDRIRALFPKFVLNHEDELRAKAEERIAEETEEPRKKLEDAKKELEDGKAKLETGKIQLEAGEAKLDSAKKELDDGEKTIEEKEQLLAEGKEKLEAGEKELKDGEAKLAAGKKEFNAKKAEAEKKIADAKQKLADAESEASSGLKLLNGAESVMRTIAKLTGNGDLPAGYYTMKNAAEKYYLPAMEAAVQQKDNTALLAEAERKVNADVNNSVNGVVDVKAMLREASDEQLSLLGRALRIGTASAISGVTSLLQAYYNAAGKANAAKSAIAGAKSKLASEESKAKSELAKAEQTIKDSEAKLNAGRKEYEAKLAEYEDGVKQLEEGKEKLEKGREEYEKGLEEFNDKKKEFEEGEKKISDGEKQYEDGVRQLDDKVAEAKAKISESIKSNFAVQNRRANTGYVNLRTNINTIGMASIAFIILFLIISALVTFSTIIIIVDEQRVLAGTMKSLGFFNKDIRSKYLVFGLSSAITGVILGVLMSSVIENIFRYGITEMFITGVPGFYFNVTPLIICIILVIAVVVIATFVACRNMLKHTAIQLMSGLTTKKKSLRGRTKSDGENDGAGKKGIYSRLIVRNMRTEKARVIITTLIIACSCGLIGVGFTLKQAFAGIVKLQVSEVWNYDIRINYDPDTVDEEKQEELETALRKAGADYASGMERGVIYRNGRMQEYTYILVLDQSSVGTYYHVIDKFTGEEMKLPENGVLIQNRLYETQGLKEGDIYILYDNKLGEHTVTVKGIYVNHEGRAVIMSREGYEALFGNEPVDNILMVHLNGADQEAVQKKVLSIIPDATIDTADKLHEDFVDIENSYNTVVLLLTGLAIFMSIFVLANLTNIFVSRRRREIVIMRVNGFSMKQGIGYLIRETLMTTLLGFVIAVGLGSAIAYYLVRLIEQPDVMLDRSFMFFSWISAILLEAVFAACIDAWVFRKVRKIKVTDINN